jgi:hypothetical protein
VGDLKFGNFVVSMDSKNICEGHFAKAEGRQPTQESFEAIPQHAGDHWNWMLAKPGL